MKKGLFVSFLLHAGIFYQRGKLFPEAKQVSPKTIDTILMEKLLNENDQTFHNQLFHNEKPSVTSDESFSQPMMGASAPTTTVESGFETVSEVGDYRPSPSYPEEAIEDELEGEVLLELKTNEDGRVFIAELKKSSGYSILDEEAIKTVKKWRLTPSIKVIVPIRFQLSATDVSESPN